MGIEELLVEEYAGLDVSSAPNKLTGSAAENKAIFDALAKGISIPRFNALIQTLLGETGAQQLGFAADELAAGTVAEALVELFRRSYDKDQVDDFLAGKEEQYKAVYDDLVGLLFSLLNHEKGAPASIGGVDAAAGDIALLEGEGIAITPDAEGKSIKISATGSGIPARHAQEHVPGGVDPLTAEIAYENEEGTLTAETVGEALDELAAWNAQLHEDVDELTEQGRQKAVTETLFATLTASWSGSAAPFTQRVVVAGILATDNPVIDVNLSTAVQTALAQERAWNYVSRIVTEDGAITAYCNRKKPGIAIPIQIKVVR